MKKFVTEDSFWQLFPETRIGVVVVNNLKPEVDYSAEELAKIAKLLNHANLSAESWLTESQLSNNKPIAVWREAYKKFKTKRGARCSIEGLFKRASKGNPVGSIAPAVDVYNALALRYAMPFGAEDVDKFEGDLRLKVTEGGDPFDPIGEGDDPTLEGELCYVDDAGAVCRCWTWRDGQRTAVSKTTRNAFLIVESVDPERAEDHAEAVKTMARYAQELLGGQVFTQDILTSDHREMVIAE